MTLPLLAADSATWQVVYDIGHQWPDGWWLLGVPVVLGVVGWQIRSRPTTGNQLFLGIGLVVVGVLLGLTLILTQLLAFAELRRALARGAFVEVNGVVTRYVPESDREPKADALLEIRPDGADRVIRYRASQHVVAQGFRQTGTSAVPLQVGDRVRLADVGGVIARAAVMRGGTYRAPAPAIAPGTGTWVVQESLAVTWQPGASPWTFLVERPLDSASADLVGPRVRLRDAAGHEVVFADSLGPGGLDSVVHGLWDTALRRENAVPSGWIYATPRLRTAGGAPMLLLFGWGYASSWGTFRLVALGPAGRPVEVLHLGEFGVSGIEDLDGDGQAELLGHPWMGEAIGDVRGCSGTYAPTFVYRVRPGPVPEAALDSILTVSYNERHHAWLGFTPNDSLGVRGCRDGRAQVFALPR